MLPTLVALMITCCVALFNVLIATQQISLQK